MLVAGFYSFLVVPPCNPPPVLDITENLRKSRENVFDQGSGSDEQKDELGDLEKKSEKQPTSEEVGHQAGKFSREESSKTGYMGFDELSNPFSKGFKGLNIDELEDDREDKRQSSGKEKAATVSFGLSENSGDGDAWKETFSFGSGDEGDNEPNPYASLVGGKTRGSYPWKTFGKPHGDDHSLFSQDIEGGNNDPKRKLDEKEGEGDSGDESWREGENEHESGSEQDDGGSDKDKNDEQVEEQEFGDDEQVEKQELGDDEQVEKQVFGDELRSEAHKPPPETSRLESSTKETSNKPQIGETNHQPSVSSGEEGRPLYPVLNFDDEKILSAKSDPQTTGDRSPTRTNPSIKRPKQLNEDEDESSDEQDDSQKKEPRFTKASHGHSSSHPFESRLSKVPGAKIIIGDPTLDEDEEDKVSFVARSVTLTNAVVTINRQVLEAVEEKLNAITINLKETEKIQVLLEWTKDGLVITSSKD